MEKVNPLLWHIRVWFTALPNLLFLMGLGDKFNKDSLRWVFILIGIELVALTSILVTNICKHRFEGKVSYVRGFKIAAGIRHSITMVSLFAEITLVAAVAALGMMLPDVFLGMPINDSMEKLFKIINPNDYYVLTELSYGVTTYIEGCVIYLLVMGGAGSIAILYPVKEGSHTKESVFVTINVQDLKPPRRTPR
jgi:hypothetical protein